MGEHVMAQARQAAVPPTTQTPSLAAQRPAVQPEADELAPPIVEDALASAGAPLDPQTRIAMEQRFGHDFSRVRIHAGPQAAASAASLRARAYTVGQDVVFGAGKYAPATREGQRLLAHELTHVVQQTRGGAPALASASRLAVGAPGDGFEAEAHRLSLDLTREVAPANADARPLLGQPAHAEATRAHVPTLAAPARIQRDVDPADDPERFHKVHEGLFVRPHTAAPSSGSTSLKPWTNPDPTANPPEPGTASIITAEFKTWFRGFVTQRRFQLEESVPQRTDQSDAEADAISMDKQIHTHFPMIATQVPVATLRASVGILTEAKTSEDKFVRDWLANQIASHTSIGDYAISETDKRYQDMLTALMTDMDEVLPGYPYKRAIPLITRWTAAVTETGPGIHKIWLNPGLSELQRRPSILHELVHYYTHDAFKTWVAATTDPRFFEEGFTEWLARRAMTPDQLKANEKGNGYTDRFDAIKSKVEPYASEDDIARAYFLGEVWRLEMQSAVARQLFGEQVGIHAGVSHTRELAESRSSPGIVEVVVPGGHYRFMNLGTSVPAPKSEHLAAFTQIVQQYVANDSTARLRFVGHASTPGSLSFNDNLSLERSKAFYKMARDAGVPDAQLVDADKPPHQGETQPTAAEEKPGPTKKDDEAQAFNAGWSYSSRM